MRGTVSEVTQASDGSPATVKILTKSLYCRTREVSTKKGTQQFLHTLSQEGNLRKVCVPTRIHRVMAAESSHPSTAVSTARPQRREPEEGPSHDPAHLDLGLPIL